MKAHPICCRALFALALALVFAGAAQAAPNAEAVDPNYRFDPVLDGAEVVHEFVIRNTGDAPLEIEKVKTG